MVECAESGEACHRCKKQFHRAGTERPSSLTHWIPPGSQPIPGELLRVSAGIHPARAGLLRKAGNNQDCFFAFTMAIRRSLIASEDFAGRRLNANASCNA